MTFDEFISRMDQRDHAIMDRLTELESKLNVQSPPDDPPDNYGDPENMDQAFLDWMNGKDGDDK